MGGLFEASNVGSLGIFIGSTTVTLADQDRLTLGTFGIIFGAVMIGSGYMLRSHPEEHVPWGIIMLILSFLSLFTAVGGLVLGVFLGGLGGIRAVRWTSQTRTRKSDDSIWRSEDRVLKSYAEEVIIDLDSIPGETERVFAIYEKSGLDGVVSYLESDDPDLSRTEAMAVATRILAEIDLRKKRNAENQKNVQPNEPTSQEKGNTNHAEGESTTAREEKKDKSWVDKWLER